MKNIIENLKEQCAEKFEAIKEYANKASKKSRVELKKLAFDLRNRRMTTRVRVFFASLSVGVLLVVAIVLVIVNMPKDTSSEIASSEEGATEISETDDMDTETADADDNNSPASTANDEMDYDSDNGGLLPETDDAGIQYIDDTLFIGDSNTVRMMNYGITSLDNTIAVVGMGIQSVKTLKCVQFSGYSAPVTMIEAVKLMQPRRIIITFGTNNANGMDVDTFISKYEEALNAIHEAYPYADILINSIPPICISNSYPSLKQSNIDSFNDALLKLSKKMGYKYIDSASVMKDVATGYAKNGYTVSDGIHISEDGFAAMFTYIRTHHSLVLSDKRPKPLAAIPKQIKATYVIDSSGKMNNDPSAYSKMSEVSKEQQQALKDLQEAALKAAQDALEAQKKATITPTPVETKETVTPTKKPENLTPTPKPETPTPTKKPEEPTPTPKPELPAATPTPTQPEVKPTLPPAEPTPTPVPEPKPEVPEEPTPTPVPAEPTPTPTPVPAPEPEPEPEEEKPAKSEEHEESKSDEGSGSSEGGDSTNESAEGE